MIRKAHKATWDKIIEFCSARVYANIERELDAILDDVKNQIAAETLTDVDAKWFDMMTDADNNFDQDLIQQYVNTYMDKRWNFIIVYVRSVLKALRYKALLLSSESYLQYQLSSSAIVQMANMSINLKAKQLMYEFYSLNYEKNTIVEELEETLDELPFYIGNAGEA